LPILLKDFMDIKFQKDSSGFADVNYERTRAEEDRNQQLDRELDQLVDSLSNIIRSSKVIENIIYLYFSFL
jgi:hypothetical protein